MGKQKLKKISIFPSAFLKKTDFRYMHQLKNSIKILKKLSVCQNFIRIGAEDVEDGNFRSRLMIKKDYVPQIVLDTDIQTGTPNFPLL